MLTIIYNSCPICQKPWEKDLVSQYCSNCQITQTVIGSVWMVSKTFDKNNFLMWFSYLNARLVKNDQEIELPFDPDPSVSLEGLQKLFNFL